MKEKHAEYSVIDVAMYRDPFVVTGFVQDECGECIIMILAL